MLFTWPFSLFGLLAVPLLLGAYLWQLRRRRKNAVRYSSVSLLRSVLPKRSVWRRHVPVALLLLGITSLGLAAARPKRSIVVPIGRTSIILALDVSRSMCATDVDPNRMTAAQDAARDFVKDQPAGTRIGIVAFSGSAQLVVAPTTDKKALVSAIGNLTTARGTAIGAAALKAIDAIAEVNPDVKPADTSAADPPPPSSSAPAPNASYVPDIVVLLTDGANTRGVAPLAAAQQAADRRVRIYTIGFGTTNPAAIVCSRAQLGTDALGQDGPRFPQGPIGGGNRSFLVIDEPTLMKMAEMTGGSYHKAEDAGSLKQVFADLPKQITLQHRESEITVLFAAIAALLVAAAMALSVRWNP